MKLNDLLKKHKVKALGDNYLLKELEERSNQNAPGIILSIESPAIMYFQGIPNYFTPYYPLNQFKTVDEVIDANIDIYETLVNPYPFWAKNQKGVAIVSENKNVIAMLKELYPNAVVYDTAEFGIYPEDIACLHVVGTLPIHYIDHCKSYREVVIKNFDCNQKGQKLKNRVVIYDPVKVTVKNV